MPHAALVPHATAWSIDLVPVCHVYCNKNKTPQYTCTDGNRYTCIPPAMDRYSSSDTGTRDVAAITGLHIAATGIAIPVLQYNMRIAWTAPRFFTFLFIYFFIPGKIGKIFTRLLRYVFMFFVFLPGYRYLGTGILFWYFVFCKKFGLWRTRHYNPPKTHYTLGIFPNGNRYRSSYAP